MTLPVPVPLPPMEARTADELPGDGEWQYEPKWDGFRCLAFKDGAKVELYSKAQRPLGRYFPEVVARVKALDAPRFVLDGELVVPADGARGLSFDALLQRVHPAASRIARLSAEMPATYVVFDLLVDRDGASLLDVELARRRARLEAFCRDLLQRGGGIVLSPATRSRATAQRWYRAMRGGLDGAIAKRLDRPYRAGERDAMVKVKYRRTADCVVGGFRKARHGGIGSLLLGLYDGAGLLHHVGFTSSLTGEPKRGIERAIAALKKRGGNAVGFTGRAPGGPSRWSKDRDTAYESLPHSLVVEVEYDHVTGGRFRHGTRFLRPRPDKAPRQCTLDQLGRAGRSPLELAERGEPRILRTARAPSRARSRRRMT